MASNGKIPSSDLNPINGNSGDKDRLAKSGKAAGAWNSMCQEAKKKGMAIPYPTGPSSSYRTYDDQVHFYNNQPPVAAYPGTSNHGWGKAVDVATQSGVNTVKSIGGKYGWHWGEAPSEWWHVTYYGGWDGGNPGPSDQGPSAQNLKKGDKGEDVHTYQGRLKRLGYHPLKDEYSESRFGDQTDDITRRFQKNNGLTVDGVAGKKTMDNLKASLENVDRNKSTDKEDHLIDLWYREHKDKDRQAIRDQMKKIEKEAEPNDWDVHERRVRWNTLNQVTGKHDKVHVG